MCKRDVGSTRSDSAAEHMQRKGGVSSVFHAAGGAVRHRLYAATMAAQEVE